MLEEAVAVLRLLWRGGEQRHFGRYYTVDHACLYTLPDRAPAVMVAAGSLPSAALAGRIGDGMIGTAPDSGLIGTFRAAGGGAKPTIGHLTVCWAWCDEDARRIARQWWPNAALPGNVPQELSRPRHFERACWLVDERAVEQRIVCSSDVGPHLDAIGAFLAAGYDQVCIHQVGPDQAGFFRFFETTLRPQIRPLPRKPRLAALAGARAA